MIDPSKRYAVFFCGYGGSCSGAKEAGLQCAIAIDNNDITKIPLKKEDKKSKDLSWMSGKEGVDWEWKEQLPAIETREKNFKDGKGVVMDIAKFEPGPEHAARFVTASPPCKRFSTAAEEWDEDDEFLVQLDDDIRNLGMISIQKALQVPGMEYYIMENVVGLINKKNKKYFIMMVDELRKHGFSVEYQIYNAADFGCCQMRQRLILVASKSGRKNLLPTAPPDVNKKKFKDIMETGETPESRQRIEESRWPQSTYLTFVAKLQRSAGQMKLVIPSLEEAQSMGWLQIALDAFQNIDILPTIPCNAGGGPTRKKFAILPFDGHGYRNPTQLEGLRAQGHDDAWLENLPKNKSVGWNMIGNSVPKPVMAAIFKHLIKLDAFYDGKGPAPLYCKPLDENVIIGLHGKKEFVQEQIFVH